MALHPVWSFRMRLRWSNVFYVERDLCLYTAVILYQFSWFQFFFLFFFCAICLQCFSPFLNKCFLSFYFLVELFSQWQNHSIGWTLMCRWLSAWFRVTERLPTWYCLFSARPEYSILEWDTFLVLLLFTVCMHLRPCLMTLLNELWNTVHTRSYNIASDHWHPPFKNGCTFASFKITPLLYDTSEENSSQMRTASSATESWTHQ